MKNTENIAVDEEKERKLERLDGVLDGRGEMTNYERIKNMSIEEMAVTIMCPNDMGMAEIKCDKSDDCNCCKCCLEWLQQDNEKTE